MTPSQYLALYEQVLAALDPAKAARRIAALAEDKVPVLSCFETIAQINAGRWCHQHLAALWL